MYWISKHKRLAIYQKFNYTCVYCGKVCVPGTLPTMTRAMQARYMRIYRHSFITLDHVTPRKYKHTGYLVVACNQCNARRKATTLQAFCARYGYSYKRIRKALRHAQQY